MKISLTFLLFTNLRSDALSFSCTPNTFPSETYTSFFLPCELKFFKSNKNDEAGADLLGDSFTCVALDDINRAELIESREIAVSFWPDRCVGDEVRCYSFARDNNWLHMNETGVIIPDGTTHMSVNCTSDNKKATKFGNDVVGEIDNTLKFYALVGKVLFFLLLLSIAGCVYCCFRPCINDLYKALFRKREERRIAVPQDFEEGMEMNRRPVVVGRVIS